MNKGTIFLLLSFATMIALGTHLLFKPIRDTSQTEDVNGLSELKNKVSETNSSHSLQLKSLGENNKVLLAQVQSSKTQIAKANRQVVSLTGDLQRLSHQTLYQVDTCTYITTCDSLQHQVNVYLSANSYKDSMVNKQVEQYELLLENKDSTIACYQSDYSILKQTTDTLLQLNERLANENHQCKKALDRFKRKTKMLTGTVLLFAGVALATQLRSAH